MDILDSIINESINRFLVCEYYGVPGNVEHMARSIVNIVRDRWGSGDFDKFSIEYPFIPCGRIMIWPTNERIRAAYSGDKRLIYPTIFINPGSLNDNDGKGSTLYATLVHELTHMYEDFMRRSNGIGGLEGEMNRIGHDLAYKKVITQGATRDENPDYTQIQKDVYYVIYYTTSFEKNARNSAMYAKLTDAYRAGIVNTYEDSLEFIKNTVEYGRYEKVINAINRLLSIDLYWKQQQALRAAFIASNRQIMTWKKFRKWLMNSKIRYENKMNTIIPKMIGYVLDRNNRLAAEDI